MDDRIDTLGLLLGASILMTVLFGTYQNGWGVSFGLLVSVATAIVIWFI